jgi:predicted kinase
MDIAEIEVKEKSYSLIGGEFFKENPDKVLAEPYEASGKYGPVTRYRPKKGQSPIDAVRSIQTPEFIGQGVVDRSAGKSVISSDPDKLPDHEEDLEIEKSLQESKDLIVKTKAAKSKKLMAWDEPDEEEIQSFEQVLREYNFNVLQPKSKDAKPGDPDVYEEYMTMDEVKAFCWYMNSIGRPMLNKWLTIFNPSIITDAEEELMIRSWAKKGILMYYRGRWYPEAIYLSGDLYEKKNAFEQEKSEIIENYSKEAAGKQESKINEAYKQIYDRRLKLDNPKEDARLKIKPYSEFAKTVTIGNWEEDPKEGGAKPFIVVISRAIKSEGEINWYSKKTSVSQWDANSVKKDELPLSDAFRYWLKHGDPPRMPHNFNWEDIFSYYLDKKAKKNIDPTVMARNRALTKSVGDKFFSKFLAEVIAEKDRVKIELEWNRKFNAGLPINSKKVPIAFEMAKNYPGNEPMDIRAEKREAVAFHTITGSSLNAYGVGLGKTWAAIFSIAQAIDAGHCKRPFLVVPNQVYKQFYAEIKGILPNRRINDLYNLSADYLNQFRDDKGEIFKVEEGSISIMTYQGFERLGFSEETQLDMMDQLKDAISMLQEIDTSTKKGAKKAVAEEGKLEGVVGKALSKSIVNIEDLGFDFVTFDEAHALKKIFSQVKARTSDDGEKGKKMYEITSGAPSTRGIKGYFTCSYIQSINKGANVLLLTATPFTNSPLEVYSMLSLVAYQYMRTIELSNINDFFDNFCQMSYELVINSKLQPERKQIFKAFDNLVGLQKLVYKFMLYKEASMIGKTLVRPDKWVLPYKGRIIDNEFVEASPDETIDTTLPLTNEQKDMMQDIISHVEGDLSFEQLSAKGYDDVDMGDSDEDQTISIGDMLDEGSLSDDEKAGVRTLRGVNFARSLALSPYLYALSGKGVPTYKEYIETSPKLSYIIKCVKSVKQWHESRNEPVSGQVIYMDRGKKYFELIKQYLIDEVGYKSHEIAIIRSGKEGTATHKEAVKNGFNGKKWDEPTKRTLDIPDKDRIKIIIGTGSIREGMNLNRYATVMYNAFVDWNPTDQIQLEGRIHRQGNTFKNVRIVIPLITDSMDIFMFQKLEEKTSRINSLWNYDGQTNVLSVEELDPQEQKMALVTNPRVIAEMENEAEEAKMEEQIGFHRQNVQTAHNVISFIRTRDEFIKEITKLIELIAPDKVGSSIEVKIKTFEDAYKTEKVGDTPVRQLTENVRSYEYSFLDYNNNLTKPWNYGQMRGSVNMIKKAKTSFLDRYGIEDNVGAIEYFIDGENGKIKKIQEDIDRIKSAEYISQRASEIELERKQKKIKFSTVDERVAEFEKLNYLLEFKRENEPAKAEKYRQEERDSCPPMTEDGLRDISPKAIRMLESCISDLPDTKALHVDADGNYTPERLKLHRLIKAKMREHAECVVSDREPIAILLGGSPGSGKTTYLKRYAPFLTKDRIFKVDADEIRAQLPEYKGWNSAATHLETQDIYLGLLDDISKGEPCKYDILWDGTMNRAKNYLPLIGALHNLGYKIFIIYIKVPAKVSKERALKRYQNPEGDGRYVPQEVVNNANKRGTIGFEELKAKVDGYMMVDGMDFDKVLDRGGEQLIENRGYFDEVPKGNELKIKRAKLKLRALELDIELLELEAKAKGKAEKKEYKKGDTIVDKDGVEDDVDRVVNGIPIVVDSRRRYGKETYTWYSYYDAEQNKWLSMGDPFPNFNPSNADIIKWGPRIFEESEN